MKYLGKYRVETHRCDKWNYDGTGIYFITICTKYRSPDFGYIKNGQMMLNKSGNIIHHCWKQIQNVYEHVTLDEFIVMPDHLHGIIHMIHDNNGRDVSLKRLYKQFHPRYSYNGYHPQMSKISPHSGSLPVIIRQFKAACTRQIRNINPEFTWQSNYDDRIIYTEKHLNTAQAYIRNNPINWNKP